MNCASENHAKHMCALKRQGLDDCIKSLSDNPTVECSKCGAKANSSEYLCAAHLGESAPSVEGGHGSVGYEDIGKPHDGSDAEVSKEPEIAIKVVPADGVCGGY
ncbi:MAG: hypothetical protein PHY09_01400 [Desulfuromonadaceae bacterium]|nr:hypothetical protein [Desulfuromonadaceae bacterium]MDD5104972.1 hypothetical protein [Desulfuromonadaceae bacterium]